MHFPIADVTIHPLALIAIGLLVGTLGGFFGVGGGFISGPLMFLSGVPMNFVIGTDLAHMTGKSIVAARRHRALGHVDTKMGLVMIPSTVAGVEAGAWIIEGLKHSGSLELVIGIAYIAILLVVSGFTLYESLSTLRREKNRVGSDDEDTEFQGVARRLQRIRIPPMVSFPRSAIPSISLWAIVGVGFLTGLLSGTLGVGGGFVRMPLMVYVLGAPTHMAVGTDLFSIMFSAGYGTITHALKGNVDIVMALAMQTGAALGAQVGAMATRYIAGPRIRLLFSVLPLIGALLMAMRLLGLMPGV